MIFGLCLLLGLAASASANVGRTLHLASHDAIDTTTRGVFDLSHADKVTAHWARDVPQPWIMHLAQPLAASKLLLGARRPRKTNFFQLTKKKSFFFFVLF